MNSESSNPPPDSGGNKIFPAYYDHNLRCYWVADQNGDFIRIDDRSLQLRLREAGHSRQRAEGTPLSPVESQILDIQRHRSVAYAAPLAGYSRGEYEISGQRILVINSPKLITPQPGVWPTLELLFSNLLGPQITYFYGWMKVALEYLYSGRRGPGQALVLAGEHDSGKSLLQNLITLLLGGRSAKPYRYMVEQTSFNKELLGAEHLMIEDEPASRDLRIRRKFGSYIKIVTVNETQSFHAKNRDAINLTPFWRLSISVNSDAGNLLILPPLDDSLEDKIFLLRAARCPMPMPTATPAERDAFLQTLVRELPAFVNFLLNWKIPDELCSQRFGITHYHDPEIRKAIDAVAPEHRLLELIDGTLFNSPRGPWEGTANELQTRLLLERTDEAAALLDYPTAAGTLLGHLAKDQPDRVEKRATADGNRWIIKPPPLRS